MPPMDTPANKLLDDCFAHDKQAPASRGSAGDPEGAGAAGGRGGARAAGGGRRAHPGGGGGRAPAGAGAHQRGRRRLLLCGRATMTPQPERELAVEGRAAAGHPLAGKPARGTAARIFTGAVMPEGHDTVVMQEDVRDRHDRRRQADRAHPAGLEARRQRPQGRRGRQGTARPCWRRRRAAAAGPGGARVPRLRRGRLLPAPEGRHRLDRRRGGAGGRGAAAGPGARRQRADAGAADRRRGRGRQRSRRASPTTCRR